MQTVGTLLYPRPFAKSAALVGWALFSLLAAVRGETLTIATYNVENYVSANRVTEAGYRQDYPKPESEKKALRMVIRGLNADVLVPHVNLEFAYFGSKERVKRGLLEATIPTVAGDVTVFGVHLKSRFTDRADDPMSAQRRIGEATAVRDCVLQRVADPASARFLILGDCNDTKESKAMQRLLRRGAVVIAELLPAEDTRGESWTHAYRKEDSNSRVDHILVSPALKPAVQGGVAHIYDGTGVRDASDHRPVVVTLELPLA